MLNHAFFAPSEILFPVALPTKFPAHKSSCQSLTLRNSVLPGGTITAWQNEREGVVGMYPSSWTYFQTYA